MFESCVQVYRKFAADERGATAIEYGLIAAMIAVGCIGAMKALGGTNTTGWQGTANKIANANSP